MFKSEREMQERFVNILMRKSKMDVFQEVGNMACFFRADVVEYSKNKTVVYELKLKDFESLIKQCEKHFYMKNFNSICAVIPENKKEKFLEVMKNRVGTEYLKVLSFDGYEIKTVKRGKIIKEISVHNKFFIADLICRGYHLFGKNKRKHYK